MSVNEIKHEFGAVVGQLLEYSYEAITVERRTRGQAQALMSARGWIEAMLAPDVQPKRNVVERFHNHDANSCDAVEISYLAGPTSGELELRVSQTLFVTTVSVGSRTPQSIAALRNADSVSSLARRLFNQPQRINLRLDQERNGVLLGRQVIAENAVRDRLDWLDTLTWWVDGTSLGFSALKRTGADQSARTSGDLQPNQIWFGKFEQSRAR